jgi:hypothetical protein
MEGFSEFFRSLDSSMSDQSTVASHMYSISISISLYFNHPFLRLPFSLSLPWRRYLSDPKWSETGDRYIVKLFRDYLFHQTSPNGAPLLDIAHVVECLTKVFDMTLTFISCWTSILTCQNKLFLSLLSSFLCKLTARCWIA